MDDNLVKSILLKTVIDDENESTLTTKAEAGLMQVATTAAGRRPLVHVGVDGVVSYRVHRTESLRWLLTEFDDGTGVRIPLHGRRFVSLRTQHSHFESGHSAGYQ